MGSNLLYDKFFLNIYLTLIKRIDILFLGGWYLIFKIFRRFWNHCWYFLQCFRTDIGRYLHSEQPQRTIKNCQIPSEISTAKLHCRNLAFCKMPATATNACPKTPSYKMGGGGARAAWRIRIYIYIYIHIRRAIIEFT